MLVLNEVLAAWNTPAFEPMLKQEILRIDVDLLPLQQALTQSSYTDGAQRSVVWISATEEAALIRARAGIVYSGIIPGCSCADDPTPMSELTEYCEVQFDIDKISAETTITLLTT